MSRLNFGTTTRRLMPLYIASFLQGIPFWYAIEKLFMVDIGFNTASIGVMVAIMSVVMLIVETPSGILADRWSRKGVMILGCLSLLISAVIGALSYSVPIYIISTVFWGIYAALYSGTYESVIYDTALEEHDNNNKFEYYLGRLKAVEGTAFIIGAFCGGAIASIVSMRASYVISLPFILLAFFFLWKFREPQLHKAEVGEPVFKHIRQTFSAVLKNPVLLPVVVSIVGFAVLIDTIFEFTQLWFIAVAAPIALYGLFSAVVFSSWTTGGLLASKIKSKIATTILMMTVLISLITMVFAREWPMLLLAQFAISICLVAIGVILSKKLHDELPSRLRAGSASVVSTLARMIIVPGSLLLTAVANKYSIFTATYILIAVAVIAIVSFLFISSAKKRSLEIV